MSYLVIAYIVFVAIQLVLSVGIARKEINLYRQNKTQAKQTPKTKLSKFSDALFEFYMEQIPVEFRDDEAMKQTLAEVDQAYGRNNINSHWDRANRPGYREVGLNGKRCVHKVCTCIRYPEFRELYLTIKSLSKSIHEDRVTKMRLRFESFIEWNNSMSSTFSGENDA